MTTTSHLGMTLVEQSQAQKEVTVNEALTRIDAVLNTGAKSRSTSTPPGSPASGDLYIVGGSPTGAWTGFSGKLAYFDQIWRFIVPNEGMTLWVNDEDTVYIFNGSNWYPVGASSQVSFVNKFRNAALDVWQRGTSGTITAGTPAHTADGWVVSCTGANVAWARDTGRALTAYSLKLTGATSVSNTFVRQRIESFLCYPLAGQQVTLQAQIFNSTGASITPTLTVKHAGSVDNWSSPTTDINGNALPACANGAWTQISYTFTTHASSGNGLEITIDFGGTLNSGTKFVQIAELDIRLGSIVGVPELRPIPAELPFNKRYYMRLGGFANHIVGSGSMFSTTSAEVTHLFETEMRAAPTAANSGTGILRINTNGVTRTSSAISWSSISPRSAYAAVTITAVTAGDACICYISSSSDYVEFTAEL